MKKTTLKKLHLNTATLRQLTELQLGVANGARLPSKTACTDTAPSYVYYTCLGSCDRCSAPCPSGPDGPCRTQGCY